MGPLVNEGLAVSVVRGQVQPVGNRNHFVLALGGFDPSCGAGVQADLRTFEAMGVAGVTVVTAVTVQSGGPVLRVEPVAADLVAEQFDELARCLELTVVKCGQLPLPETAELLACRIERLGLPLVLDPVFEAGQGGALATGPAREAVVERLFSLSTVLTVNAPEAAAFTGAKVDDLDQAERAAEALLARGPQAVVVKGGHLAGDPVDILATATGVLRLPNGPRRGAALHGTGCAFASALAAALALGLAIEDAPLEDAVLEDAVRQAQAHVRSLFDGAVELAGGVSIRRPPSTTPGSQMG